MIEYFPLKIILIFMTSSATDEYLYSKDYIKECRRND